MGVREIDRSLEQWQMGVKDLRRRVILAPTPRERERWYAILLLAQGLTAAATAEALERDPHTIGRWASAFGEGGPAALIFEQTGGSPPALDQAQQEELKGAVEQPVSRVNYICRLASISFAGSPPWPGPVAGQHWSGSWGRQTPG